MTKHKIIILLFGVSWFLTPRLTVYAQEVVNLNEVINSIGGKIPQLTSLSLIVSRSLYFVYAIAGIGLLVYFIGGGFGYLTSSGDPKKTEAAKNTITTALLGFIIIFAAFWITQIVNYIFGLGSAF